MKVLTVMSRPHLLFILKQKQGESLWSNPNNKKPGLSNSIETLVRGLVDAGVHAEVHDVVDANKIHEKVCQIKPDVVVIEAYWVKPGKLQLLKALHPKIHWIVRNHSEVPFLAQEGMAGAWNCEYLKMGVELSSVSQRTVEDLLPLVKNLDVSPDLLTHLPNIYKGYLSYKPDVKMAPGDEIHIGCFGAIRPMKNHVEQALAAIGYAHDTNRKLFFHINGTRVEGNGSQPLKHLQGMFHRLNNCALVEHPWMDKETFYNLLINKIDVLLQCSLTESFNIVAADAVLCSVPVVASSEIRWLGTQFHCDPTNANSIQYKIQDIFENQYSYIQFYTNAQRQDLEDYNQRSVSVWLDRF